VEEEVREMDVRVGATGSSANSSTVPSRYKGCTDVVPEKRLVYAYDMWRGKKISCRSPAWVCARGRAQAGTPDNTPFSTVFETVAAATRRAD
jgi:hypothetical protein